MVLLTKLPQVFILLLMLLCVSMSLYGKLSRRRVIYLGLYSGNASDTLRAYQKPADSLLCYDFAPGNSTAEQCKFYGDCCVDPMRIRDRLEPGTFSCQTTPGYTGELVYVIDKCPSLTEDKKLVASCQQTKTGTEVSSVYYRRQCVLSADFCDLDSEQCNHSPGSLSMATWPVTAKRTGLLYKNIFCAICHGVLTERDMSLNSTDYSKSVDFWWLSVNCMMGTISKLSEEYERFTIDNLEPFIKNGECGLRFSPPSQPHRCLDAVRSCPDNFTDVELKLMCEQGPVSYTRGEDGIMYRNYFCQLCHGQDDDLDNVTTVPPLMTTQKDYRWPHRLINIQPQMQLEHHIDLSRDDYVTNSRLYNTSTKRVASTNNMLYSYEYSVKAFNPPTNSSWNFGSLLCESLYKGICDKLISRPRSGCGGPGCGVNSWQDASITCYESSNYNYQSSSREQAEYIWPHSLYGGYSSSCNREAEVDADLQNCRCDSRCHYFGECCFDTPLPENYIHSNHTLKYSCVRPEQCWPDEQHNYSYAIISTCPTGSDIILNQFCNQGEIGDWSPVGWTVYDSHTNLSYKNVYCAMCNNVSPERVRFWQAYFECHQNETLRTNYTEDLYSREWLGDCSFIRFVPKQPEIAYMCSNHPIVSSCPHHLADWKIAEDCTNEPTSWVSHDRALYRNAYCAICNLDDGIMDSDIDPVEASFVLKARAAVALFNDEIYRSPDSVILDVSENKCCYRNECMLNTHSSSEQSPWGEIGLGNSSKCLMRLPFDTACEDKNFVCPDIKLPNLFYLCSGSFTPFAKKTPFCSQTDAPTIGPGSITPSFAKLMFTDFGDIPFSHTFIYDNEWMEINNSLLLCSNGTNLITTSGQHYSKLRLSPSTVEVKQITVTENFNEPSLEVYDYILLSLSLLSLSVYTIYILIDKKQRSLRLPGLMKLSILVSLFGALICYSLANIPAGKDMIGCQALAAMQQFLFLSTFTWTSAFGINITQVIYTMRPTSTRTKLYLCFAVYAIGLPLAMVIATFSLSKYHQNIPMFKSPVYREYGICFLHETYIIIPLFLAPIYIIVASNVILCIICMVRVGRTAGMTTHDKDRWKKILLTCMKLSVCMGVPWTLIFVVSQESQSLDLSFKIIVEIQGLLIVAANVISWECIRKVSVGRTQTVQLSHPSYDQLRTAV